MIAAKAVSAVVLSAGVAAGALAQDVPAGLGGNGAIWASLAMTVFTLIGAGGKTALDHFFRRGDRREVEHQNILTGYKDLLDAKVAETDKAKAEAKMEREAKHTQAGIDRKLVGTAEQARFAAERERDVLKADLATTRLQLEACKTSVETLYKVVAGMRGEV